VISEKVIHQEEKLCKQKSEAFEVATLSLVARNDDKELGSFPEP
jgi:hypothetical protein